MRFAFTPAAAYVRAARLVAADVASHAGVATGLLDEVRQAVGEACTRAILRHRDCGLDDLVRVEFSIGDRFIAKITDNAQDLRADSEGDHASSPHRNEARSNDHEAIEEDTLSEEITLIVLGGLVEDLVVTGPDREHGTTVTMSWPLPGRSPSADH
ncbi:ATP-binding protein [Glycomyces xiaoerkulensis]|uniref:ATP-binding protein n=1 Tax=Glycomyces xiaoerkulensis TaxID=2038139 RepID=UPI0013000E62|nr:ATP-binding protein [Glycomyces xiaoerkulensis]